MKRLTTILLLFCTGMLSGLAQFVSHCTFYTEDDTKITVYLDGEKKNEEPQTRVRVINLTEPFFKLKIVFADSSREPIVRKTFLVHDTKGYPVDVTYSISKNRKGVYKMHFMNQTIYPGYIKPVAKSNAPEKNITTPDNPNKRNCTHTSLSDSSFALALNTLSSAAEGATGMLMAKQIISANCISVEQIRSLMDIFPEEAQRLEIAKYAYNSAVDKGNYFMLNDKLKDPKSIEELYGSILKN